MLLRGHQIFTSCACVSSLTRFCHSRGLPPSIWQCNPRGTTSGPTKYSWRQNSFPKDLRGKSFPVVCRRCPRCRVSYGKKARVTYVGLRKRSSHTLENKTIHSTILAQGKEEKWVAFPKTRTLPSRNFQPNCVKSTRRNGCSHGGKKHKSHYHCFFFFLRNMTKLKTTRVTHDKGQRESQKCHFMTNEVT